MKITVDEVLMGRDKAYPLNIRKWKNLCKLLVAINHLRNEYGKPMYVSSGYRPGKYNTLAGGSQRSSHLTCQAVDFKDPDRQLTDFCLNNVHLLEKYGIYMEHPDYTIGWVHLQVRPTRNRIFNP